MNGLFIIKGEVIKGNKRGKSLGFPTANVKLSQEIPEGIYISIVFMCFAGKQSVNEIVKLEGFKALTFIGAAKTFGEKEIKAETYILNFDQNLYGHKLEIRLLKKIRANQEFANERELIKQMKKDLEKTKKYFKQFNCYN